MSFRSIMLKFTFALLLGGVSTVSGQDAVDLFGDPLNAPKTIEAPKLVDAPKTIKAPEVIKFDDPRPAESVQRYIRPSKPTAKEIRQARALYRSQQRDARIERNLWMGYEPLRPNWSALPMMSSPYSYRRTIYIPMYVR